MRLLLVLLPVISLATPPVEIPSSENSRHEPSWEMYVRELKKEGYATDKESLEQLVFEGVEAEVRLFALKVLEHRGNDVEEILWKVLAHDESRLMRETAAVSLARLGRMEGLSALRELFESSGEPRRKLFLASRLVEFGVSDVYPFISITAQSEDRLLRLLSVAPLVRLCSSMNSFEQETLPCKLLRNLSQDPEFTVRREVVIQITIAAYESMDLAALKSILETMASSDSKREMRDQARNAIASWEFLDKAKGKHND